jgi:hypothetical protein
MGDKAQKKEVIDKEEDMFPNYVKHDFALHSISVYQ